MTAYVNSETILLSKDFPSGFERHFDAHIYYHAETRVWAARLREQVLEQVKSLPIWVGALRDEKVGPHPTPMFEINFPRSCLDLMKSWLEENRGNLSVLIHEVTGDDPKDHSEGALWLGRKIDLDLSKLAPSPRPL